MCQKALRSRFSGTPHHPPQKDSASQYCASGSPASANGVQIAMAVAGSPCSAAARPSSKLSAKAGAAERRAESRTALVRTVVERKERSAIVEFPQASLKVLHFAGCAGQGRNLDVDAIACEGKIARDQEMLKESQAGFSVGNVQHGGGR